MPGVKGKSGGARPGTGRKRIYRKINLTEQATKDLKYFIDDLNLDPRNSELIVSTILSSALTNDLDKWRELFGNRLTQNEIRA